MSESRGVLPPDDHPDLPLDGGSEPVMHMKDPVPGPGVTLIHWAVILLCVLIAFFVVLWIFGF